MSWKSQEAPWMYSRPPYPRSPPHFNSLHPFLSDSLVFTYPLTEPKKMSSAMFVSSKPSIDPAQLSIGCWTPARITAALNQTLKNTHTAQLSSRFFTNAAPLQTLRHSFCTTVSIHSYNDESLLHFCKKNCNLYNIQTLTPKLKYVKCVQSG